jgi:NADH pyrophosphatase NudC (nudix superfamily)
MELSAAVDINGLSIEHQKRIREVGLDRWMDEQCSPSRMKPTASDSTTEPTASTAINKPRRTWRNCAQCGKPFLAKRADARLCSPKCRVRAVRYPQERPACNT